jgi:hypothetical protein
LLAEEVEVGIVDAAEVVGEVGLHDTVGCSAVLEVFVGHWEASRR